MRRTPWPRFGPREVHSGTKVRHRRWPAAIGLCFAMTACADLRAPGPYDGPPLASATPEATARATAPGPSEPATPHRARPHAAVPPGAQRPRIVTPARRLQCVPYARRLSNVKIHGDAVTWWRKASGRYARSWTPRVGSVLVLRGKRASRGHVAVVTRIVGPRDIVVSHANWLNRGRIHLDTPVRDVSRANDWSAVRVWYTPGNRFGATTYGAHGFIHPRSSTAALRSAASPPG